MTFLRYLLVQVAAYAIDVGTFLMIFNAGVFSPSTSNAVSKLSAGIFAYLLLRPDEVLSGIPDAPVLEIADNAFGILFQAHHVGVGGLA